MAFEHLTTRFSLGLYSHHPAHRGRLPEAFGLAERGAAPATVPRKHRPGTPRVSRPLPLRGSALQWAGRGRTNAGESCGIGRAKSPPSKSRKHGPGVQSRRGGAPRGDASCATDARAARRRTVRLAPLGAPPPHFRGRLDLPLAGHGRKARPAPLNISRASRNRVRTPARGRNAAAARPIVRRDSAAV